MTSEALGMRYNRGNGGLRGEGCFEPPIFGSGAAGLSTMQCRNWPKHQRLRENCSRKIWRGNEFFPFLSNETSYAIYYILY